MDVRFIATSKRNIPKREGDIFRVRINPIEEFIAIKSLECIEMGLDLRVEVNRDSRMFIDLRGTPSDAGLVVKRKESDKDNNLKIILRNISNRSILVTDYTVNNLVRMSEFIRFRSNLPGIKDLIKDGNFDIVSREDMILDLMFMKIECVKDSLFMEGE